MATFRGWRGWRRPQGTCEGWRRAQPGPARRSSWREVARLEAGLAAHWRDVTRADAGLAAHWRNVARVDAGLAPHAQARAGQARHLRAAPALRCGLPRWYMRGRPALWMTDAVRDMPGGAVGSGRAAARQAVPAPLFRLGAAGRSAGRAAVPRVCCCLPWRDFNGLRILRRWNSDAACPASASSTGQRYGWGAVRDMPGGAVGSGRAAARQAVPAPLFRLGAAGRSAGRAAVPQIRCCLPWRDFNGWRILRPGPPWPGVRVRARQWRASAVAHPLGWWVRCSFCRCSRATRV